MNDYEKEYKNKAERLANEIKTKTSFQDIKVIKGDNGLSDYRIILRYSDMDLQINNNWKDNISLSIYPYKFYNGISSYKQSEIRKEFFVSNNMKVITEKKLLEKIVEEIQYHNKLVELQNEYIKKQFDFITKIKASGLDFIYSKNEQKEILSGYIVKNGLEYSFELCQDGYIKQETKVYYAINNDFDAFIKLSDNKFN